MPGTCQRRPVAGAAAHPAKLAANRTPAPRPPQDLADLGIKLKQPHRIGEHRAPCPWCARGPKDDALAVSVEPDAGATWYCHRCQAAGGIAGANWRPAAPRISRARPQARQDAPGRAGRSTTIEPWAAAFWTSCRPIDDACAAGRYLARRGCMLPDCDPEESHLRWRLDVRHRTGHVGPAIVAMVTDVATGEPISLHRTWITPDGSGKAEVDPARLLLKGHRSDGVCRLWPDADVTTGLVLGEGIETCLAAAAAGLTPVWATISAGNLARFQVLPGIEGLTILVDHDRPNPKTGRRAGIEAGRTLIERYAAAGFDPDRDFAVIMPPLEGEDAADLMATTTS